MLNPMSRGVFNLTAAVVLAVLTVCIVGGAVVYRVHGERVNAVPDGPEQCRAAFGLPDLDESDGLRRVLTYRRAAVFVVYERNDTSWKCRGFFDLETKRRVEETALILNRFR
jgi:hypothetical protein